MIDISPDQRHALDGVRAWLDDPTEQTLTLGGLAGTGKTTLIREIMGWRPCAIAALTGKAAFVLRTKGVEQACTLHSLIYQPQDACKDCGKSKEWCTELNLQAHVTAYEQGQDTPKASALCPASGTKTRFLRVPAIAFGFVIVDEASMLNRRIVADLEAYRAKVLYVGDHGQLEPIGEDPRLMVDPQIRLEQIHRQADGSAIIHFAHRVRKGERPGRSCDGDDDEVLVQYGPPQNLAEFDVVLCGYNKTRVAVNARIRERRRFSGLRPEVGERVICLRNDSELGIFNGMQATVMDLDDESIWIEDDVGNRIGSIPVMWEQFGQQKTLDRDRDRAQFDFGYALTVHKSQGSEFKKVCVLEQIAHSWSAPRWRYTAATRASERLVWCLPK